MTSSPVREQLADDNYIRAKMFTKEKSSLRLYADLVVGEGASYGTLFVYELITGLLGGLPGGLGLALRRIVYPRLFRSCGRGVTIGRHVVIRNGRNITLGDNVVIDDGCVIDGRGAGERGVVIGDRVIIGRLTTIQAKIGPISIGADSNIGALGAVHAQGGVEIGRKVVLGGGCSISGGSFQTRMDSPAAQDDASHDQTRWTKGPIRIGDGSLVGMGAMILDGVEIGRDAVLGAGTVMAKDVPANAVAAGVPGKVLRMRDGMPSPAESRS